MENVINKKDMKPTKLKLPVDVLCDTLASDEEAVKKAELFFQTPAGVNLQAQFEKGVFDEVGYRDRFNQLFAEFLKGLSAERAA